MSGPQPQAQPQAQPPASSADAEGEVPTVRGVGRTAQPSSPSRKQYDSHRDEIVRNVQETHKRLRMEVGQLTKENASLRKQLEGVAATVDAAAQAKLEEQKAKHEQDLKLISADRDVTKTELEGMRRKMGSMLKEQSQSSAAHEKLVAQYAKIKVQNDAQNKLSNSQNQKLLRERSELEAKLAAQKEAQKKTAEDLARAHRRELERAVEDEQRKVATLREKLAETDRVVHQLAESNDRKDAELQVVQAQLQASVGRRNAEDECAIAALRATLRDAESELIKERENGLHFHVRMATAEAKVLAAREKVLEAKAAKAAGVPERSVACSTDTIATSTHECAMTQTVEDARVLPEHLPTSVKVLAKIDDAICVVQGTHGARACESPNEDEHASPASSTASTGATSAAGGQSAHGTTAAVPPQPPQQDQPTSAETAPQFHALSALAAVQWLVQWTQGCDAAGGGGASPPHGASPPPHQHQHQFCHGQLYVPHAYSLDGQHPHWRGEIPFAQFPPPQQPAVYDCGPPPAFGRLGAGRGRAQQPQPRHHYQHR